MIVINCGASACGKSTIAERVYERLRGDGKKLNYFETDYGRQMQLKPFNIRIEQDKNGNKYRCGNIKSGLLDPETEKILFGWIIGASLDFMDRWRSDFTFVDAMFALKEQREKIIGAAVKHNNPYILIYYHCSFETAKKRNSEKNEIGEIRQYLSGPLLAKTLGHPQLVRKAGKLPENILEYIYKNFQPPKEVPEENLIEIDTDETNIEEAVEKVYKALI